MGLVVDIIGKRFGRFTVISRNGSQKGSHGTFAMWLVKCDCGTEKTVRGCSLRNGEIVSCGCYNREITTKRIVARNTIHGKTHTPEYRAYQGAKKRCTSKKDAGWKNYGGRGILFLLPSFSEFYQFLGPRPTPKHSLDRKDNDKHYTLDNVRWATKEEQMNNRRTYTTIHNIKCANCGCTDFVRTDLETNVA